VTDYSRRIASERLMERLPSLHLFCVLASLAFLCALRAPVETGEGSVRCVDAIRFTSYPKRHAMPRGRDRRFLACASSPCSQSSPRRESRAYESRSGFRLRACADLGAVHSDAHAAAQAAALQRPMLSILVMTARTLLAFGNRHGQKQNKAASMHGVQISTKPIKMRIAMAAAASHSSGGDPGGTAVPLRHAESNTKQPVQFPSS